VTVKGTIKGIVAVTSRVMMAVKILKKT